MSADDFFLALLFALLILMVILAGCATSGPIRGSCGVKPYQSEQAGVFYFRYQCIPDKEE